MQQRNDLRPGREHVSDSAKDPRLVLGGERPALGSLDQFWSGTTGAARSPATNVGSAAACWVSTEPYVRCSYTAPLYSGMNPLPAGLRPRSSPQRQLRRVGDGDLLVCPVMHVDHENQPALSEVRVAKLCSRRARGSCTHARCAALIDRLHAAFRFTPSATRRLAIVRRRFQLAQNHRRATAAGYGRRSWASFRASP